MLRINAANSDALDLDRASERAALARAGAAGIGAWLVHSDPAGRYQVTEYIAGRQWQPQDWCIDGGVERIAGLLQTIHGLAPISRALNVSAKAAAYWHAIDACSEPGRQLKALQTAVHCHIAELEAAGQVPCFCHNDLVTDNVIVADDRRLYAIDWEYAAMGDPYFDLAVIVEEHGLDSAQCRALLVAYIGVDGSDAGIVSAQQHLYHARVVYCYLSLLWYAVQNSGDRWQTLAGVWNEKLQHLKNLLSR